MSLPKLLLLFFIFFSKIQLFSQPYSALNLEDHYLFQDRISKGLIFDILQDSQGVLWFATEFGLCKYDGKNLVYYHHILGEA